jgi:ubiquinone/menaquinone biosynthesis C-methylase UbiE
MADLSDGAIATEEARIKSAYAKRSDGSLYSWFNPAYLFHLQELERRLLAMLRAQGLYSLNDKKILEIGCGEAYWLREFIKWGARPENITGIDFLPERIAKAKQLCPQGVGIHCANAGRLAFENDSFDLVLQFTVFTSILDFNVKKLMAREMLRVARDSGCIIWFDYHVNNPWNPDVRGIRKHEIRHLFPGCHIELHRVTLAPPLARILAPYSWLACYALQQMKIFNTHYLGLIRRK